MSATIPHAAIIHRSRICAATAIVCVLSLPSNAAAQAAAAPPAPADAFSRRGWHLELSSHFAPETWNYNTSREEMYGINAGLTYGLREGLLITARAPFYYVSQRGVDAMLLGVTAGVRVRVYRHQRVSIFLEIDVGVSQGDTILPPRGTRFNYLAMGGVGATIRLRPGVHLLTAMRWMHVSNGGREGRSRNPDIEAVGPQIGVLLGF
jgi:hypothetical protein